MVVVDIDSHWEPARDGLDPDERVTVFAEVLAGDLYREVPRDEWPAIEQLVPPVVVDMFRNPGVDPTTSSPGAPTSPDGWHGATRSASTSSSSTVAD